MRTFRFKINEGQQKSVSVDFVPPAGTLNSRVVATNASGSSQTLAGASSISGSIITINIPSSYAVYANFPAKFEVQLQVNGGAWYTEVEAYGYLVVAATPDTTTTTVAANSAAITQLTADKEQKVDAGSLPIFLYGNSYSILTSNWHTSGKHYSQMVKDIIKAGTVTSYGQSGKRILDVLYSLINESVTSTALITAPIAGSKWPGTASRTGIVILESTFNDFGHYPTMVGTAIPAALPTGNTQYRDCLKAQYRTALAIMSSASRIENASFTVSGTWTRGSAQPYASGGLIDFSTASAAYAEVSVTPPQRGPLAGKVFLLTYTVPTGTGTMAPINVSVDGGAASGVTISPWESYLGPGGSAVSISPYIIPVTVPIDGNAHTVRFTHNGAAGNLMYVDCMIIPSETPNSIAVMGCENGPKAGAVWNAAQVGTFRANLNTLTSDVKGVVSEFPNAVYVPSTMTDNGLYSNDGIHPNDRGMAQRANDLYNGLKSVIPRLNNKALESQADSNFTKV